MPAPTEETKERLSNELALLEAMYPESITFDPKARELNYTPPAPEEGDGVASKGLLVLRLPDTYPAKGLPDLITAKDARGQDARTQVSAVFGELGVGEGEEVLDAYVLAFQEFTNDSAAHESEHQDQAAAQGEQGGSGGQQQPQPRKTVVIWLHHLLNTNKRKLALSPSLDSASVSGLTRPGYPGVMVFSGPRDAVDSHVGELRAQRWQAFQVRYDSEEDAKDLCWAFEHGPGIREVESLGDLAQGISGAEHREMFIRVMGLK